MTNEEIQSIMNSTFGGLAIFCRDLNLDENLIDKYQLNQIIQERGFTDVSHKIGGIAKNCRYLIASSKGKDLSAFSQTPELGHIVIQSSAFYKVLDIQKEQGKTQILLLHIPEEGVAIFGKAKINIEDQVIEKGIEIFKRSLEMEPLQELQSKSWVDRTAFPIGMSDTGAFFMNMQPQQEVKATSNNTSKTERAANKVENTPKKEEKKRGFWSKLFGKK